VGIIGLGGCGKSTLINRAFGVPTNCGSLDKHRTRITQLYQIPESNYIILDFPGTDDIDYWTSKQFEAGAGVPSVLVVVINFGYVRNEEVNRLLRHVVQQGVPTLICLNKAEKVLYTETSELFQCVFSEDKEFLQYQVLYSIGISNDQQIAEIAKECKCPRTSSEIEIIATSFIRHTLRHELIYGPDAVRTWIDRVVAMP
jgi:putative ribosome biogenesis GTPase RsgA